MLFECMQCKHTLIFDKVFSWASNVQCVLITYSHVCMYVCMYGCLYAANKVYLYTHIYTQNTKLMKSMYTKAGLI